MAMTRRSMPGVTRMLIVAATVPLVAACGRTPDRAEQSREIAASGFVPPVTQAPAPIEGQRNGTPLTAYAGHDPRDAVGGVSFFDRTEVANALIEAVPEEALRHAMTGREATATPVFLSDGRVAAHGCAPHDCADRHWTVMIAADGNVEKAAVCYHDARTMGDASRWSTRADTKMRPGGCPQA
jgi:hypothetical protein